MDNSWGLLNGIGVAETGKIQAKKKNGAVDMTKIEIAILGETGNGMSF